MATKKKKPTVMDRLKNVANVYSTIFTGKTIVTATAIGGANEGTVVPKGTPTNGLVTQAGNKNILTTAAEHPLITAGVIAGGVTAAGYRATGAGIVRSGTSTGFTTTAASTGSSYLWKNKYLIGGAAGVGAALLLGGSGRGGSGGSSAIGDTNQTPSQNVTPSQEVAPSQRTDPFQKGGEFSDLRAGRDLKIDYSQPQYTYPQQSANPMIEAYPSQGTYSTPTSTGGEGGSSGISPLMIALIAGGIFLLSDRR